MSGLRKSVLVAAALASCNALAQQAIEGTWQGKLALAPDTQLTVQFIIKREADGTLSAMLNSPDAGAIKNVAASSVTFDGSHLGVDVKALSGAYTGVVGKGTIEGKWMQEGTALALNLTPYVKTRLTGEVINRLAGQWVGKIQVSGNPLTVILKFERSGDGKLTGLMDIPDQGASNMPIGDIEFADNTLLLRIPAISAEISGTLQGDEFAAQFKRAGQTLPVAFKKSRP